MVIVEVQVMTSVTNQAV